MACLLLMEELAGGIGFSGNSRKGSRKVAGFVGVVADVGVRSLSGWVNHSQGSGVRLATQQGCSAASLS